jgi:hypothetical protein
MRGERDETFRSRATGIALAQKVCDYYEEEMPKYRPNYPLEGPDDEEPPPPPEEAKLRTLLEGLPMETLEQLNLLMNLGRWTVTVDDLASHYEDWKGTFGTPGEAVAWLIGEASLASYLENALDELRKHKINIDKLPLKQVPSRQR